MRDRRYLARDILDGLSLIAVSNYIAFRFLQNTTFPFVYSGLYKAATMALMVFFGGVRFLYVLYGKLHTAEADRFTVKQMVIQCLLIGILSLPFIYSGMKNDFKLLIFMPVAVVCLYDMKPEKVLKAFAYTVGIFLFATILCSLSGCIRNMIFDRRGTFVGAYGTSNTTDFAAYFLFVSLCIWCVDTKEKRLFSLIKIFALLAINLYVYRISGSQTSMLCCALMVLLAIWDLLRDNVAGIKEKRIISGIEKWISVLSLPVIVLVFLIGIIWYTTGSTGAAKLDEVLSYRLSNIWNTYTEYGISLFGKNFVMNGNGGTLIHDFKNYSFLDSSYAYLPIRYGLIISGVFLCLWIRMIFRTFRSGYRKIAFSMAVVAVYAFSEAHLLEVNYNVFMLMPLCAFREHTKADESRTGKDNKGLNWAAIPVLLCIAGVFLVALSCVLPFFRNILYVQGWNSGMRTLWPLLIWLFFTALVVLLCKTVWGCSSGKWKRIVACVLAIVLAGTIGIISGRQAIQRDYDRNREEILREKSLLEQIQAHTAQPIYVFEKPETYRSAGIGSDRYVMTAEDFCRKKEGTIITDSAREVLPIILNGGKYIQISEKCSAYSFDKEMINALSETGWEWNAFYTSERTCDLEDLARLNHLELSEEGYLIVTDPEHSLKENRYVDQFTGNYEVRISVCSSLPERSDREICTIRVTGYKGEREIITRKVYANELDETGNAVISIPYSTNAVPKVEYLVEADKDVTLQIKEIAWKRIS